MISFFVGALCISFVLKGFFFFSSWISGCKLEDCLSSLVGIRSHHLGRQFQVYLLFFFFFATSSLSFLDLEMVLGQGCQISSIHHHLYPYHLIVAVIVFIIITASIVLAISLLFITVSSLYHARMCVDMRCPKRCKLPLAPDNVVG